MNLAGVVMLVIGVVMAMAGDRETAYVLLWGGAIVVVLTTRG